jgi:RHS repeat-associated protein
MQMTASAYTSSGLQANDVGDKLYELSNHLGNVLQVVTDTKLIGANQVLVNNDFSSTYAPLTQRGASVVSLESGRMKVANAPIWSGAQYIATTIPGHKYRATCTIDLNSSGNVAFLARINFPGGSYQNYQVKTATANGTYFVEFVPESTTTYINFENANSATRTFYLDNFLFEDITPHYTADVVQQTDYYPYGMVMPNRNGSDNSYRYGFNGMEKDDEAKGAGNSYDFGARMYDSRLGRWLSVDPLGQFIGSQYSAFANNPILLIDTDGRWVPKVSEDGRIYVEAEEGDDYKSLMEFFGGEQNAKDYLQAFYFGKKGSSTTITTGTQIWFNNENPYSKAIVQTINSPEKFSPEDENPTTPETYNCHTSAIMGTQGNDFRESKPIDDPEVAMNIIKSKYEEVSSDDAVFGKTVMTHGFVHMEVFFGRAKNGNTYIFTKNGSFYAPKITTVKQNIEDNITYGAVRDIDATYKDDLKEPIGHRGRRMKGGDSSKILNGSGYYNQKKEKTTNNNTQ